MKSNLKLIVANVALVLVILVLIEIICTFLNPNTHYIGFLINPNHLVNDIDPKNGFEEIDPLLGYAKTKRKLEGQGFKVESNCMVIYTSDDTSDLIPILITGGSTSDLSLYINNWPVEFSKILKANGIKTKIYIAAVGGYNSGQEVLKLIRDGLDVKPSIHISYSGANEIWNDSYITVYEQAYYENSLFKSMSSWILPNTVFILRNFFKLNYSNIQLHEKNELPPAKFWSRNMKLMHGIAVENNYLFLGMLQPVLGSGKYNQMVANDGHEESIALNKKYFPQFREVSKNTDYVVDLTDIFDTCTGIVFMDNCHINDSYQKVVAINIYNALIQKKVFDK